MIRTPNLQARDLTVLTRDGGHPVLWKVGFLLNRGELTAIVGESGSGKTTVLSAILGLLPEGLCAQGGSMMLSATGKEEALDLGGVSAAARRHVLGKRIGYVPQDCLQGLDPIMTVEETLRGVLLQHRKPERGAAVATIENAMRRAGLPEGFFEEHAQRRPTELSGGQRQRILIASAQIHEPQIVLYDEPTTALDPLAKRRVLDSIRAGIEDSSSALVVSHDIAAMRHYADRVYVLYGGEIVEQGRADEVFGNPQHPYTQDLLRCLPRLDQRTEPRPIPGAQPSLSAPRIGCRYRERCRERVGLCETTAPVLAAMSESRSVSCHVRT